MPCPFHRQTRHVRSGRPVGTACRAPTCPVLKRETHVLPIRSECGSHIHRRLNLNARVLTQLTHMCVPSFLVRPLARRTTKPLTVHRKVPLPSVFICMS